MEGNYPMTEVNSGDLTATVEKQNTTERGEEFVATCSANGNDYSCLIRNDKDQGVIAAEWSDADGQPLTADGADELRTKAVDAVKQQLG